MRGLAWIPGCEAFRPKQIGKPRLPLGKALVNLKPLSACPRPALTSRLNAVFLGIAVYWYRRSSEHAYHFSGRTAPTRAWPEQAFRTTDMPAFAQPMSKLLHT